jgi:hypothetical protein
MLYGIAKMIITKAEMIHAVNCYFYDHVQDKGGAPYATVVDVRQTEEGTFEIDLIGRPDGE